MAMGVSARKLSEQSILSLDVEARFSFLVNEEPISLCEHLPQVEEPHDRQTPDTPTRDNTMNTERTLRQK